MSDSPPTHAAVQAQFNLDNDSEEQLLEIPASDEINFGSVQEERIFEILQDHRGADSAITAAEIADQLHIEDTEGSPKTRSLLTNLLFRGVPLVSQTNGNPGFYLAETAEEGLDYINTLDSRIEGTRERRDQAVRNIIMNLQRQE